MNNKKQQKELEKDLLFFLRYYQKIAPDSRKKIDYEIKPSLKN